MATIQLPDGHTAEIRDDEVRRSDARFVMAATDREVKISGDQKTRQMQAAGFYTGMATMQDAVIARFVKSWSLTDGAGQPLPITLEVVQDLPMRFYKPLAKALTSQLMEVQIGGDDEGEDQQPGPLPSSAGPSSTSASTD